MSNRASRERQKPAKQHYLAQHPAPEMRQTRALPLPVHTCKQYQELSLEQRMELLRVPGHVMQITSNGRHLGSIRTEQVLVVGLGQAYYWQAYTPQGLPLCPGHPSENWRVAVANLKAWAADTIATGL